MKLSALIQVLDQALFCTVELRGQDEHAFRKTIGSASVTLHLSPQLLTPAPASGDPAPNLPPSSLLSPAARLKQDEAWLRTQGWSFCGENRDRHLWHRSCPGVLIRIHPAPAGQQGPTDLDRGPDCPQQSGRRQHQHKQGQSGQPTNLRLEKPEQKPARTPDPTR